MSQKKQKQAQNSTKIISPSPRWDRLWGGLVIRKVNIESEAGDKNVYTCMLFIMRDMSQSKLQIYQRRHYRTYTYPMMVFDLAVPKYAYVYI